MKLSRGPFGYLKWYLTSLSVQALRKATVENFYRDLAVKDTAVMISGDVIVLK